MGGYTKLWSDIITSSVWNEDNKTRIVWITMLATANARGFVSGVPTSMAILARVEKEDFDKAIGILTSPDPESRTPDHDGRRIEKVEGGWLILNYENHRNRISDDPAAISSRERQKKWREKHKEDNITLPNVGKRDIAYASDIASSSEKEGKDTAPNELAKYLIDKTSEATGRNLVTSIKSSSPHISKLLKTGIAECKIKSTIDWLTTVNMKSDYRFEVQSGKALFEKWDKVQSAMARGSIEEKQPRYGA